MARFLQNAVHTAIGHAHPLTGEQLTATKDLSSPVAYYKPNARNHAFIDPEGEVDGIVMFQKVSPTGLSAKFALMTTRTDIVSLSWDFDEGSPVAAGRRTSHTFGTNNRTYDVEVTATLADTTTEVYTVTVLFGTVPPVNSVLPAITGTAQAGQTLTASNGTWSGSPTYTRQWKKGGVNISGATGTTYLVDAADVGATITVTVTATNAGGAVSATSTATATVIAA